MNNDELDELVAAWGIFSHEMELPGWDEMSYLLSKNVDAQAAYNTMKRILGPYHFRTIYPEGWDNE